MKAIIISQSGDASVLKYTEDAPVPRPARGQVLVKIHAAGINFVDIYYRRGDYKHNLPYIPGLEASGVIEKVEKMSAIFLREIEYAIPVISEVIVNIRL